MAAIIQLYDEPVKWSDIENCQTVWIELLNGDMVGGDKSFKYFLSTDEDYIFLPIIEMTDDRLVWIQDITNGGALEC